MKKYYKLFSLIGFLIMMIGASSAYAQNKKIINPAEKIRKTFTDASYRSEPQNLISLYKILYKSNRLLPATTATSWWLEHQESYSLNILSQMLELDQRTYFAYDANDRVTEQLSKIPDPNNAGSWLNSTYTQITYDANGNITETLNQNWNNNAWVNSTRIQHTYSNNLETMELGQNWDTQNGWVDSYQYLYTYDSSNNLTEEIDQTRDLVNSVWVNTYRYTYTYSNGNIATEEDQEWVNGQWRNVASFTANYNMQNRLAEVIEQDYDTVKTMYINAYRDQYMYYQVSLKDSAYVTSKWDTTNKVWTEDSQILRFYDSNGNDTKWLYQDWDSGSSAYVDNGQQLYTYDSNMNLSQLDLQTWTGTDWTTFNQTKNFFSSTRPDQVPLPVDEGIARIPTRITLSQNYPNPFNPTTQIRYDLNGPTNVRLMVYDIIGRQVATLVNKKQSSGSYIITFNASGLSSGIYFYRLVTDKASITRKMLLLK